MNQQFKSIWLDRLKAMKEERRGQQPLTLPQGMRYDAGVSKEMVLENTSVRRSNRPDSAVLSCPNSISSFGRDGQKGNLSRTACTGVFNILPTLRLKTPGDLKVSYTEHDMNTQVATISATPDLEIIEGQITTTSQTTQSPQ